MGVRSPPSIMKDLGSNPSGHMYLGPPLLTPDHIRLLQPGGDDTVIERELVIAELHLVLVYEALSYT